MQRGDLHLAGQLSAARPRSLRFSERFVHALPVAKITEIRQFTPTAWVRANAKEKLPALAA